MPHRGGYPRAAKTDNVASTLLSVVARRRPVDLVASSIEVRRPRKQAAAISVRYSTSETTVPLTATGAWIRRIVLSSRRCDRQCR
jgi:hypothetical protein